MTASAIAELAIPAAAGESAERFAGESPHAFFVVATQPGRPPVAEGRVMSALEMLHAARPIERTFVDFDGEEGVGFSQREIDVSQFRVFPNKRVNRELAQASVGQGWFAAAKGFAIACEPATELEAIDDWYAWASQKEALEALNAEAGSIALASQVVAKTMPRGSAAADAARGVFSLVRLAMTAEEWRARRHDPFATDPTAALHDLWASVPEVDAMAARVAGHCRNANRFYEDGIARTDALVRGASESMQRHGSTTGAIVLGLPWLPTAASLLRAEDIGFVRVVPSQVTMVPMLDEAGASVGENSTLDEPLSDVLLGKPVRDRIERWRCRETAARTRPARRWSVVAERLLREDDLARAGECIEHALELLEGQLRVCLEQGDRAATSAVRGALVEALAVEVVTLSRARRPDEALASAREHERICRELHDQSGRALSLANQALLLDELGRTAESEPALREAERLVAKHSVAPETKQQVEAALRWLR